MSAHACAVRSPMFTKYINTENSQDILNSWIFSRQTSYNGELIDEIDKNGLIEWERDKIKKKVSNVWRNKIKSATKAQIWKERLLLRGNAWQRWRKKKEKALDSDLLSWWKGRER